MVRQRLNPAWGRCFRDIVLWPLADANKENPGPQVRCRLVGRKPDGFQSDSALRERKNRPPERNIQSMPHFAELLLSPRES